MRAINMAAQSLSAIHSSLFYFYFYFQRLALFPSR